MTVVQNLAAFVVTYKRKNVVLDTLRKLAEQTVKPSLVLLIDNADDLALESALKAEDSLGLNVEYIASGSNLGPAGAAALGLRELINRGYGYAYWVDDDDPPLFDNTLQELMAGFARKPQAFSFSAVGQRWSWRTGRYRRLLDDQLKGDVPVDVVGGNGQWILNLDQVKQLGLPQAELFWGLEEIEYGLRASKAGYEKYVVGELMLKHRRATGRLGRVRAPVRQTSEMRRYYTMRNYIYMMCFTFKRIDLAALRVAWELMREIKNLITGRPHYVGAILTACRDGVFKKLGFRRAP